MATLGIPQNTIDILKKYDFHFQKKFGQNFLIDTHVLEKIIDAAGVIRLSEQHRLVRMILCWKSVRELGQ